MKSAFLIVGRAIAMPFVLGWQCFLFFVAVGAGFVAQVLQRIAGGLNALADRITDYLSESTY